MKTAKYRKNKKIGKPKPGDARSLSSDLTMGIKTSFRRFNTNLGFTDIYKNRVQFKHD